MVDWCKQTSGTSYSMLSWDRSNTLKESDSGDEFMIQTILLKKLHYTSTQTIFCEIKQVPFLKQYVINAMEFTNMATKYIMECHRLG